MAFQPAMINATESLLAPGVGAPAATGGGDSSGLFQMLLAGASAPSADASALQVMANPTPQIASANNTGAMALLLQTTDTPAQTAPVAPEATSVDFTPASADVPAVVATTPAPAVVGKPAAAAPPTKADGKSAGQTSAVQTSPAAPTDTTSATGKTGATLLAGGEIAAAESESVADPAAPAQPAPQAAALIAPDAVQAIVFAPLATQTAAATPKEGTAAKGEAIDGETPSPSAKGDLFKKIAFVASSAKANAGGASTVAVRAAAAEALSAPPAQQQQRADSAQAGVASPIAGFEAPRPAADALSAPVARAPHGAAAMQIAQSITRNFNGKSSNFEVRLDPAELGRVDVKISVDHDKRVTASVSADNPQTLTDLRGAAREIERALSEAGLDLAQGGLSFEMNQRQANDDQFDASPYAAAGKESGGEDSIAIAAKPFGMERWSSSGVDVWA